MRRLLAAVAVTVLCLAAVSLHASGIDNKTNWSAGYARTMNRNAVYDSPDAAVYNPAGIGMFEKGLYTSLNNQSLFPDYSHEYAGVTYSATNPTWFLPSAFVVYKRDKLGFYGAFYVPAGGGSLEYDDGIVDLNVGVPALGLPALAAAQPSVDLFGVYYAGTGGAVFSFNEKISTSAGLRYIYGTQEQKFMTALPAPSVLLDTKATTSGFGGIFGVDFHPVPELNLAARYETNTGLEWEYQDVSGPLAAGLGIAEGGKFDRDLPAILAFGASYLFTPKLKVEGSVEIYFNKSADWGGDENDVDNGFAAGAAAEYLLIEKLKVSGGFLYTSTGADPDSYIYLNPALDSFTIAGGALYRFTEKLSAELGVIKPFYTGDSASSLGNYPVDVDKSLWIVALGVSYKIF